MPPKPSHVDATPGVRTAETPSRPTLSPETSALRLIHGKYTVDLVPLLVDGEIPVFISTGELGTPPPTGSLPIGLADLLVEAATVVRGRRVIDTAAWCSPLVADAPA